MSMGVFQVKRDAVFACVIVGLIFFVNTCIPGKYLAVEDSAGYHQHIKLKFFFQDPEKKQSGKILLKFDRNRTRMLFLSSLNQVYIELLVENDVAWLVNTREKKFWKGKFRKLITEMWKVDLTIGELHGLLAEGSVPEKKLKSAGFDFSLQMDRISGKPRQISLFDRKITLLLKIQSRVVRSGGLPFNLDVSRLKKCDLRSVLANE